MYSSDNSYAICLADGKNYYLAGTSNTKATKITKIIGEPFMAKVYVSAFKGLQKEEMILVECEKGLIHSVMNRFSDTPIFPQVHEQLDFFI